VESIDDGTFKAFGTTNPSRGPDITFLVGEARTTAQAAMAMAAAQPLGQDSGEAIRWIIVRFANSASSTLIQALACEYLVDRYFAEISGVRGDTIPQTHKDRAARWCLLAAGIDLPTP
jgi:hypothetical protein